MLPRATLETGQPWVLGAVIWTRVKTLFLAARDLHADMKKVAIYPEAAICLPSEFSSVPRAAQMSTFLNIALVLSNS